MTVPGRATGTAGQFKDHLPHVSYPERGTDGEGKSPRNYSGSPRPATPKSSPIRPAGTGSPDWAAASRPPNDVLQFRQT